MMRIRTITMLCFAVCGVVTNAYPPEGRSQQNYMVSLQRKFDKAVAKKKRALALKLARLGWTKKRKPQTPQPLEKKFFVYDAPTGACIDCPPPCTTPTPENSLFSGDWRNIR